MFYTFFEKYLDELRIVSETSEIKSIMQSEEYFFNDALIKYKEFKKISVEGYIFDQLLTAMIEPFSISVIFDYSEKNIQVKRFVLVIEELMSFVLNAKRLDFFDNKFWLKYLLKYKLNKDINDLPEVVINLINYLENPDRIIPNFFDIKNYSKNRFNKERDILTCMCRIGLKCKNPLNDAYVCSKILNSKEIRKLWNSAHQKTWLFTPGENTLILHDLKDQGKIVMGWFFSCPLNRFYSKNEIEEQFRRKRGDRPNYYKDNCFALWQFANEILIGDSIIVKDGTKTWIGEVTSDYIYDVETADIYRHVRYVNWNQTGKCELRETNALITFKDITVYSDICESDEKLGYRNYEEEVKRYDPTNSLDRDSKGCSRVEQSFLRKYLFDKKRLGSCGICGKEYPVSFLVTAHIKNRASCTNNEKLDYENIVMPMCKFGCDDLYEKGYITVVTGKVDSIERSTVSKAVLDYISSIKGRDCPYWNDKTKVYFDWQGM